MRPDQVIRDVAGLAGMGLLGYGAWLYDPPLGFIVPGATLLLLAIAGAVRGWFTGTPDRRPSAPGRRS